ncbi:hypothetical protein A1D22_06005 [Pasteurellaceae bacterium LFhippo2]|nr:hypothetical protein [Pasteurellaceae bacterium LFhippo2]
MQRNWDLIRRILLKLEEKADPRSLLLPDEITGFDKVTVSYHFKLLHNAQLIEATSTSTPEQYSYSAICLTWDGHEFLDKVRNDSVWNKVKGTVQSKSLDLSFDVIKQVATATISAML